MAEQRPIEQNALFQGIKAAKLLIRDVYVHHYPRSLIVCGPPGVGKTTICRQVAEETANKFNVHRPKSAREFVAIIHRHRRGGVVTLEDLDSLWDDRAMLEISKIALDTTQQRVIGHEVSGPTRIKPFSFQTVFVSTSNKDFNNAEQFNQRIWATFIEPVKQRSFIVRLSFDVYELYEYSCWLATDGGMFKGVFKEFPRPNQEHLPAHKRQYVRHWLSAREANEVLDHFHEYARYYPGVSPRDLGTSGTATLYLFGV